MAINFPASPTVGQTFSSGGKTWVCTRAAPAAWKQQPVSVLAGFPASYISGLQLVWVSGSALNITSGACYIPGSGKVVSNDSPIALTGLAPGASVFGHVYVYESGGVLAGELSTTVPSSAYNGTARTKSGDPSRRYLGSVLTNTSGGIFNFIHFVGASEILYVTDVSGSPFTVVNGAATSATSVSCAAVIPVTGVKAELTIINNDTTAGSAPAVLLGTDAVVPAPSPPNWIDRIAAGAVTNISMVLGTSQTFQYMFNITSPTGNFVARVKGYGFER